MLKHGLSCPFKFILLAKQVENVSLCFEESNLEFNLNAPYSESELLEEEVDSLLLLVALIWVIVSKHTKRSYMKGKKMTYLSVKICFTSFFKAFLVSLLEILSSVTIVLSSLPPEENSPATWNLVGRMWL